MNNIDLNNNTLSPDVFATIFFSKFKTKTSRRFQTINYENKYIFKNKFKIMFLLFWESTWRKKQQLTLLFGIIQKDQTILKQKDQMIFKQIVFEES